MTPRRVARAAVIVLALVAVGLGPAACGKKGDPMLPEGQTDNYPRRYPDPTEL